MKKVVIGMSGGVDSSVAAYLLKQQGYEVVGLFMRNWDSSINNDIMGNPTLNENICTQEQDYNDALKICKQLGIELFRIDFVKEYWENVFLYFLDELKKGRTPNPDVMCNKYIKFDYFVKYAKKLGADYIATGHYARIENKLLLKAKDQNKDQTYFLNMLTPKQLENVLFPIGDLNKEEVRKIANELKFEIANKKDSTGICFIGERNFKEFLKNYLPNQKGKIVDIDSNQIIGEHIGLMYYTIGQRRGLDIGGNKDKIFVVGKNLEKNILYTCHQEKEEYLYSNSAIIEQVNWIQKPKTNKLQAKFRYRQKDNDVEIEFLDNNEVLVKYNKIKAVTPGQFCVFYDKDICCGGGIIKTVQKNNKSLWYLQ